MQPNQDLIHQIFIAKGDEAGPIASAIRALIVFVFAIACVRMAKKRFIAQASAADFVMVVVLGSMLSRGINGGATLLGTLVAGLALVGLQRVFAHFSAQSHKFGRMVKGSFEILVKDGAMDRTEMRHHDISEHDLMSELRINGMINDLSQVGLAVLERSGRISVVKRGEPEGRNPAV